jgi:CheY-like chemotaxis protein
LDLSSQSVVLTAPILSAERGRHLRLAENNRRRVLILDNNAGFAGDCAYILERLGYETNVVYDPTYALTKVDEFHPHIAVIDIGMADSSGLTIGRLLRDHYARHELALIAVSIYSDPRTRDSSAAAGFDAHLSKPVSERDLLTIIDLVLDKRLR